MAKIYDVLIDNGTKYLAQAGDTLNLKANDWCVIRKDFYLDYGKIVQTHSEVKSGDKKLDYPKIQRKATVRDQGKANENKMRSKSAFRTALKQIEDLKLPMKLINSHYSFDGKLVSIQFTSDGRVDFRELVKTLSQSLSTRIELRQIGVRDETAIYGGLGVCGRALCCVQFLKEFASINVRMAKDQDLSLNPSTISGICGRLKCCLKYEHEGYLELQKDMPRRGDVCECEQGRGKICDRNLLTKSVVVSLDETGRQFCCCKDEVRVVYPEKYKIPRMFEREDELDEEEAKKLED